MRDVYQRLLERRNAIRPWEFDAHEDRELIFEVLIKIVEYLINQGVK